MRSVLLLLSLVACEKSAKKAPPPGEVIDQGTIVTTTDGVATAKETFEIRKNGDRLIITASSASTEGAKRVVQQDGELETDLSYRPLRLTYHYRSAQDSFSYKLGGTPLALDRTRDDGQHPEHIEAKEPVEVFVEGPGLIAMQALCRVDKPTTLTTLSDFESGYKGKIVVKRVVKAATLTRIAVKFLDEFEIEVYCDGPKLIGSGLRSNKLWNVREGSEAVFEAARDAP